MAGNCGWEGGEEVKGGFDTGCMRKRKTGQVKELFLSIASELSLIFLIFPFISVANFFLFFLAEH